jgi:hypothetical protein
MALKPETKAQIKERSLRELKRLFVLFVYLSMFLGSFTVYRRLVLEEYRINYLHYGYALFEALILAKVIMIGELLKVGERFRDKPLIVPTLYNAVAFSLLVFAFSALEELVVGAAHHQSLAEVVRHISSAGISEKLARALVMLVAFIPLFAYRELGRVLGEGKLFEMFYKRRPAPPAAGNAG